MTDLQGLPLSRAEAGIIVVGADRAAEMLSPGELDIAIMALEAAGVISRDRHGRYFDPDRLARLVARRRAIC